MTKKIRGIGMKWFRRWLRKKLSVDHSFESLELVQQRIDILRRDLNICDSRLKTIESMVDWGVDSHPIADDWVVLCMQGKQDGSDFVGFFRVKKEDAKHLKEQLLHLRKTYGGKSCIEAPYGMIQYLRA